jgi:tetratricopeptide (TPR) repeat protein
MGAYSNDKMIITADTSELLTKLKENRSKHKKEYEEAVKGWNQAVEEARKDLSKLITIPLKNKVRKEEREALKEYNRVLKDKPTSHDDDYAIAIDMLSFHREEKYKIERDQFRKYIQDDWDWKYSHQQSMAFYTQSL